MWAAQNRKRYDRSRLRYPSDLTMRNGRMSYLRSRPPISRAIKEKAPGLNEANQGLWSVIFPEGSWFSGAMTS
jgi:hypothetical protein